MFSTLKQKTFLKLYTTHLVECLNNPIHGVPKGHFIHFYITKHLHYISKKKRKMTVPKKAVNYKSSEHFNNNKKDKAYYMSYICL